MRSSGGADPLDADDGNGRKDQMGGCASTRIRHRLAAATLALLGAALLSACTDDTTAALREGAAGPPPPAAGGTALHRAVPAAIAGMPLIDAGGRQRTLAGLRGKVVVLTDVLTTCQEVCPLVTANLRQMQRRAGRAGFADDVEFVEVTIDPKRDNPARLRAYQRLYQPGPNWLSLTGTSGRVEKFWRFFGVASQTVPVDHPAPVDWFTGRPSRYDVQHSDALIFVDRQGRERYLIFGSPDAADSRLPPTMRRYLSEQGRENLAARRRRDWTVAEGMAALRWVLQPADQPQRAGG